MVEPQEELATTSILFAASPAATTISGPVPAPLLLSFPSASSNWLGGEDAESREVPLPKFSLLGQFRRSGGGGSSSSSSEGVALSEVWTCVICTGGG